MFSLARLTLQRARQERLPQVAGSLAFTTLLSLVPMLAVGFALFTHFPIFRPFELALEQHLLRGLLPGDIARTVLKLLQPFAAKAGTLTWLGWALLLATAVAMLWTVERVLNQMWNVRKSRPLLRRIGMYLGVLALAPPLLGFSLWAMSTALAASLGWFGPLPPSAAFVLTLGPMALGWAGLSLLFYGVPHTRVRWRDAIVGGLLASVALEAGKRAFATYLLKLPSYQAVYGTFAVFPLFLLWIYFSWLVTLAAALVAANLGRGAARPAR